MRTLLGAALAVSLAAAAERNAPVVAKNGDVEISARLILDKDDQIKAVGSDLARQYVIVELTVKPRGGYPVTLSRDDFLLRSSRDNERSTADSPDRIAGSAVLVMGQTGGSSRGGFFSEENDPIFVGGLPGTGGPPRRVGGDGGSIGSGGSGGGDTMVKVSSDKKSGSVLSVLREKELPLGETGKPVAGYLYFAVDPKQKPKNFHLHYKGPNESCELKFK